MNNPNPNSLPIVLLDLNYTLVANSDDPLNKIPYPGRIINQTYRIWLIEMIQHLRVFIVTARDARYRDATLDDLRRKTGWQPERSYWNTHKESPPSCKLRHLNETLFPEFGRGSEVESASGTGLFPDTPVKGFASPFFAIESNPRTRQMYAVNKIPAFPCQDLQTGKVRITGNEHPERLDIQKY